MATRGTYLSSFNLIMLIISPQALPKNPRLTVVDDSKFVFKPPYPIKGKTSLVKVGLCKIDFFVREKL